MNAYYKGFDPGFKIARDMHSELMNFRKTCRWCSRVIGSKNNFIRHLRTFHPPNLIPYLNFNDVEQINRELEYAKNKMSPVFHTIEEELIGAIKIPAKR